MRVSFVRLLLFLLVATFGVLASAPAFAGDVQITVRNPAGIHRKSAQGVEIPNPTTTSSPLTINGADCRGDVSFDFDLVLSGNLASPQPNIQAWAGAAGADCTADNSRTGNTITCWPVTPTVLSGSQPGITMNVRVQDMLSQAGASTKTGTYAKSGIGSCSTALNTTLNIYFLAFDLISTLRGNSDKLAFPLKTIGPAAPTLTAVRGGENALHLEFTPPGGSTTGTVTSNEGGTGGGTTTDILSYTVYCSPKRGYKGEKPDFTRLSNDPSQCVPKTTAFDSPPPKQSASTTSSALIGEEAGADAGDLESGVEGGTDAGASTEAATPVAATQDAASSGTTPSNSSTGIDDGWICSSDIPAAGAKSARIEGFEFDYPYQVAIAANDSAGNRGTPSSVMCGIPVIVDDFWDQYKGNGGLAGGGYCALEGVGMPVGAGATGLGMVGAAAALIRRRKRS